MLWGGLCLADLVCINTFATAAHTYKLFGTAHMCSFYPAHTGKITLCVTLVNWNASMSDIKQLVSVGFFD